MATRKEKHARALAQREAYMEEQRLRGLQALEAARKKREIEVREEWKEIHDEKHYKFVKECPLCKDIMKDLKHKEAQKAVGKVAKASVNA